MDLLHHVEPIGQECSFTYGGFDLLEMYDGFDSRGTGQRADSVYQGLLSMDYLLHCWYVESLVLCGGLDHVSRS